MIGGEGQLSTMDCKLVNKWLNNIHFRLFPATCILCSQPGQPGLDLCPACEADLPVIDPACHCCGMPLSPGKTGTCGQCLQTPPPFFRTVSPFYYEPPLAGLITQFKFRQRLLLGRVFASLLHKQLAPAGHRPDCLIPVPLHPRRLRERGYNQALEIAHLLGASLAIPVDYHLCQRRRYTTPQTGLAAKERKRNIKNAFALAGPCTYRHVAILDDVVTTGHTVTELASLLQKNGVEEVEVWSVARAVPE